ncbi:restriction endonuclease subunit S [Polaribacter sp. M15]
MNKDHQKIVPLLRFPEFSNNGEWNIDKFSSFIKLFRGSSPRPISQFLTKDENGVNWIKIGDTKNAVGFKISQVEEKITVAGSKKSRKVKKGELILANSMSYGATYELELEGCIYDGWFVLREFDDSFDKQFLLQLLNSDFLQVQYKRLAAGGIVKNISSVIVYNTLLPELSIKEQQKIANCLSSLDDVIKAEAEKLDLLVEHKKGLLQKLFPQEGETIPKYRFPEFKNDKGWEEKKLSDFDELISGDGDWILSKDITLNGGHQIVQLSSIGFGKFKEKDLKTISDDKFSELNGTSILKGDLLINRMVDSSKINSCIFPHSGKFVTSVDICWIRENEIINNYFFMNLLCTSYSQKKLLSLSSGAGRVRISKKNLFANFVFLIPKNPKEQQKIAKFLSSVDVLINAQTVKIQDLKYHKKGLLQQLFPNINEVAV